MIGRNTFACALALLVGTLMVFSAAFAQEQDDKSSKELLQDAGRLYKVKKYEAALGLLEKVDRDELGQRDKSRFDKTLANVRQGIEESKVAQDALKAGEAALKGKKFGTAVERLRVAAGSSYLDETLRNRAKALLSAARQGQKASLAEAKQLLKEADAQLNDGQLADAKKSVNEIRNLDVRFGRIDQWKFDRLTKKLAKQLAAGKPVVDKPAPKVDVKPVADLGKPKPKPVDVVAPKPVDDKEPEALTVEQQAKLAKAKDLTKKGKDALKVFEWRQARNLFRQALVAWPDYADAQAGLKEAEESMGAPGVPLLRDVGDLRLIEKQRVNAQLNELFVKAQKEFRRGNHKASKDAMDEAELRIRLAKILGPEEAEDLREKFHSLSKQVDAAAQIALEDEKMKQAEEARVALQKKLQRDKEAREKKRTQLWESAKVLRKTMRYSEAIQVLDRLLEVDPTDDRAAQWRDDMQFLQSQLHQIGLKQLGRKEIVKALTDVRESAVALGERLDDGQISYLRYLPPKEWKELVERHAKFLEKESVWSEPPAVTAMRAKLQQRLTIDMESPLPLDRFLFDVVREKFREVTGTSLNIVIDETAILEETGREDISEVLAAPIQLEGITVERVLRLALPQNIGFDVRPDLILVTTRERLRENLPARTYPVRDLTAIIPDHAGEAPSFQVSSVIETGAGGAGGAGGGGGGFGGGFFDQGAVIGAVVDEGTDVEALKEIITRMINPSSDPAVAEWVDEGGNAAIEEIRGILVITQTETGHKLIKELLDKLRAQRAVMVSVEARFITVSDDFLQDITLDVDIAFVGRQTPQYWRDWDPGGGDVSLLPTGSLPGLGLSPPVPRGQPIIITSTGSNSTGTSTLLPLGGTAFSTFTANEGGLAIGGVFFDQIQLGFLLRAIQADKRSTTLWAPRVTMYDGQRSYISVSRNVLYVSDLEPVVGAGDAAAALYAPTISSVPVGTTLDVRATVSADRKYVQLDLWPQVVNIGDFTDFSLGTTGAFISLPEVTSQDIRTTVSVPDGGTVLLGGLKKLTEHDVETGVPILSKFRFLSRLFSNRASLSAHSNLIILVTPRVIIQAEQEDKQTGQ